MILGKEGLCKLGFDIPVDGKVIAQQTVMLNRAPRNYGECSEKHRKSHRASRGYILCELKGLDKWLRSIRGLLKVEVAKKVELQQCME